MPEMHDEQTMMSTEQLTKWGWLPREQMSPWRIALWENKWAEIELFKTTSSGRGYLVPHVAAIYAQSKLGIYDKCLNLLRDKHQTLLSSECSHEIKCSGDVQPTCQWMRNMCSYSPAIVPNMHTCITSEQPAVFTEQWLLVVTIPWKNWGHTLWLTNTTIDISIQGQVPPYYSAILRAHVGVASFYQLSIA